MLTFRVCLQVYRKRTEAAKKLYLKQLATYRASLLAKVVHVNYVVDSHKYSVMPWLGHGYI